jgi:hypothetical protein
LALGKTLGEIDQMPQSEFLAWQQFYVNFPFDDMHRFHRPAALVARSVGGGEVQQLLDWLMPEAVPEGLSEADVKTMKAFGLKPSVRG